jgi:hypothetical protein
VLTGDTQGRVHAYRTYGLDHEQVTNEAQIKRLQKSLQKDDYAVTKAKEEEGDE